MIIEAIADLHFGRTGNEEKFYESLKNNFIKHCNKVHPDLIVILGDSFDSRQGIGSPANIYYEKFIDDCIAMGATIIVIEGTESHDRHQINGLLHYSSDKFFIVNTVTKLNVCGLKLLLLPEEYVITDDYYKDYFNDDYDFVFFHGMFTHVGINGYVSDEIVRHVYNFDWKMFKDNVKHFVIGGHIHTHSCYKNIIYCGSYGRLNFGEEEDKGWIEIEVKGDKSKWVFMKNPDAMSFTTILASKLPNEIDHINGIRDDNSISNLRSVDRKEQLQNLHQDSKKGKPKYKLSELDVYQIKLQLKHGKSTNEIAKHFNVSRSLISDIKNNRRRKKDLF